MANGVSHLWGVEEDVPMTDTERHNVELWKEFNADGPKTDADYELHLVEQIARLKALVEAADYLQHCRRRREQNMGTHFARKEKDVERASDEYDYLRSQVKL